MFSSESLEPGNFKKNVTLDYEYKGFIIGNTIK